MTDSFVDANGERVIAFTGRIRNLARIAELTASIIEMAESDAWRDYRTAIGREQWLDAEFDYFLIACQMQRDDIARVLAWNSDSSKLAPLMDREAGEGRRRTLEAASEAWGSPGGETLLARARRLGWLGESGRLSASPIPRRARTRASSGVSADELARRRRAARLRADRRREIDALADSVASKFEGILELRYFLDRLASTSRARGGLQTTASR